MRTVVTLRAPGRRARHDGRSPEGRSTGPRVTTAPELRELRALEPEALYFAGDTGGCEGRAAGRRGPPLRPPARRGDPVQPRVSDPGGPPPPRDGTCRTWRRISPRPGRGPGWAERFRRAVRRGPTSYSLTAYTAVIGRRGRGRTRRCERRRPSRARGVRDAIQADRLPDAPPANVAFDADGDLERPSSRSTRSGAARSSTRRDRRSCRPERSGARPGSA